MNEVALGEICDLLNGYAFKSSDYVDLSATLSCRMSNIRPGGYFNIDYNARYLPDEFAISHKQFLLRDDDVVIAMTDLADSPKILGVPTIVKTGGKNILLNQRVGKLIIKNLNRIHFPYLKLALNYPTVRSVYKKYAGGGLQINLGKADLLSVKIPLPPLEEQKRIAAILDKADAVRRKRQQAIELADQFLQSVFLDMFGHDPLAKQERLGDLCDVKGGKRLPKGADYANESTAHPYIRVVDFRRGTINQKNLKFIHKEVHQKISRYTISADDVFISIAGTIGLCGVIPDNLEGANLTENAAKLVIKDKSLVDRKFLLFWLNSAIAQKQIKSKTMLTSQPKLALFRIKELVITLPDIVRQKQFTDIMLRVYGYLDAKDKQLKNSNDLFNSLSQQAFKGELTHDKAA